VDRIALQGQTGGAYKAYFSPDGKWLLTMVDSMITILDAANLKELQRVLKVGASPMGIGFSADGTTALVANHGDGTVSVVDLATARVTRTFKAGTASRRWRITSGRLSQPWLWSVACPRLHSTKVPLYISL
jgi:YVTN family beta-propeller protein